jgi:AcrR family transcriptional regulator
MTTKKESRPNNVRQPALNLRTEILAKASNLFATDGFDKVSTRDIADSVGIKQATLYHYFPSKADIYKEVIREAARWVSEQLFLALSIKDTPEERIRSFFRASILVFRDSTPAPLLVDRELVFHGEDGSPFDPETTRQPHDALSAVIREIAPECPAEEYALLCFALAHGARKQRSLQFQLNGVNHLSDLKKLADSLADWSLRAIYATPSYRGGEKDKLRILELERENREIRDLLVDRALETKRRESKRRRNPAAQ